MAGTEYWGMDLEGLAAVAGNGGFPDSEDEKNARAAGRVLSARVVCEASKTSKHLVWATWSLVVATIVVNLSTRFVG